MNAAAITADAREAATLRFVSALDVPREDACVCPTMPGGKPTVAEPISGERLARIAQLAALQATRRWRSNC
jgi:hypothetical protein